MSMTDREMSDLRNALPVSVSIRLSDDQLRSALDEAHNTLGPGASTSQVQGAAWLLAHPLDERREQVDHMLQIATMRREYLIQAERHLLGAFLVDPDAENLSRDITMEENMEDLARTEALLGVLIDRAGGVVTVTHQQMDAAPSFAIEPTSDGLQITALDNENEDHSSDDR
jgi:hypothetical protein